MARGLAGSGHRPPPHSPGYLHPVLVSLARHTLLIPFPLPECPPCPPGRLSPAHPSGLPRETLPKDRPPRAPSPPKPSPFLRLLAQRMPSSPSRLPVRVERPSPCGAPTASGARPRPQLPLHVWLLAWHLRLGAFRGPFKEWDSRFLGPLWQMTTHLVCTGQHKRTWSWRSEIPHGSYQTNIGGSPGPAPSGVSGGEAVSWSVQLLEAPAVLGSWPSGSHHVSNSASIPTSPSLTPVSPSRSYTPCDRIGPTWLIQGHLPRQKP